MAENKTENKMVKIYTKKGDEGKTSLCDIIRIAKSDLTFDVLGDIDELSASIGLLIAYIMDSKTIEPKENLNSLRDLKNDGLPDPTNIIQILRRTQNLLLDIGSNIATVSKRKNVVHTSECEILLLEKCIDFYTENTPNLTNFILPGYTVSDSQAHLCRAISRRAERNIWKLNTQVNYLEKEVHLFQYLNRLSDFFFALARYLCILQGKKEVIRGALP